MSYQRNFTDSGDHPTRPSVSVWGRDCGPRQRGKHILASRTAHSLTQNRHVFNMHTGTLSASVRDDCPLTRFLLPRRMTGSPMSSLGVSFSDSAFPMPLRCGSSLPEHLRRVDVSFININQPCPSMCVTPKHYRIISKGSSEGFSPWFLLLGSTSSASGMLNMCVSDLHPRCHHETTFS
jgi:hypothetical protein